MGDKIYTQAKLEKMLRSRRVKVRVKVAKEGHRLDVLVHDPSKWVRIEVAQHGFGLETLVNDTDADVRMIARTMWSFIMLMDAAESEGKTTNREN